MQRWDFTGRVTSHGYFTGHVTSHDNFTVRGTFGIMGLAFLFFTFIVVGQVEGLVD